MSRGGTLILVWGSIAAVLFAGPITVLAFVFGGPSRGMLTIAIMWFIGMLIYFFAIRKALAGSAEGPGPAKRKSQPKAD